MWLAQHAKPAGKDCRYIPRDRSRRLISCAVDLTRLSRPALVQVGPLGLLPVSRTPGLGVLMKPEVAIGKDKTDVQPGVQARGCETGSTARG